MKTNAQKLLFGIGLGWLAHTQSSPAAVANLTAAADTFISSNFPENNDGGQPWFDAGTDGMGGVRRGLIRINLSSIPAGSTIDSAVLQLTVTRVPGFEPMGSSFQIFRMQTNWTEGTQTGMNGAMAAEGEATWNSSMSGVTEWTTPGAASDAAAVASASTAVGNTPGAGYTWSGAAVASDVQFWLDHPAENFGWLLRSAAEGTSRSVRGFGAREDAANAGMLQVTYTPPADTNFPPAVNIVSPTNGTAFDAPATVTIDAMAIDSDGSVTNVEFFDGGASLGNDATFPYSISVNLLAGTHTLSAVARDNGGAVGASSNVVITVSSVVITNPIASRIPKGTLSIEIQTIADGMTSPLGLAAPDDGSGRLFVYDQSGLIWLVTPAGRAAMPMLDIRGRLIIPARYDYDERGLLGLAVHPNFALNPYIYTYSSEPTAGPADFASVLNPGTTNNHQSVIAEWRIDTANTNRIDPASRRELLRIDQPQSNHNGGAMNFGPDGFLYVALGDGGAANDVGNGHLPGGNAQNPTNILGKLLRIDINGTNAANGQYGLPVDNPFDGTNGLREIYAYGLRNPFSFSFDRSGGQLYVADVGQNRVEEIDVVVSGGNYGWNIREGSFWFDSALGAIVTDPTRSVPPGLIDPIAEYDHDDGLAVVGGYVYRGAGIPPLQGRYVFGDWGTFTTPSGRLFYLDTGNVIKEFILGLTDRPLGYWIKGFGEGPNGEIYVFCSRVIGPAGNTGVMFKIVPGPEPISFTSITRTNSTNVAQVWRGGQGPYALQQKTALAEPAWFNATLTNQTNAVITMDTPAGFLRVVDTAHQPGIPLSAHLTGLAERPTPLVNNASGSGLFSLDGNTLAFNVRYTGLSGPAIAAHIHGPAPASTFAGVIIDLAPYNGGAFGSNGSVSGVVILTDAQKSMMLAGRTYVNFHTSANTSGEMRGQIAPVLMHATLNGANERPDPVSTTARGLGVFALVGNQLAFNLTYHGLSGTASASHIHGPATMSSSASVLIDLSPYNGGAYGASGSLAGTFALTPDQLALVVDGLTYVNFHTAANGGGEIRGQLVPQSTAVPLTAPLTGLSERPTPIMNSASGSGFFSLEDRDLTFSISYRDLSSAAIAAHIHGPSAATNFTGVLIDLSPFNGGTFGAASGTLAGTVTLNPAQRDMLLNGQTYVNVHTVNNGGGEIRGQIATVLMKSYLNGAEERPNPVFTDGSAHANLALVLNQLSLNLTYRGLSSSANASHIHGPSAINQGAGVLVDLSPLNGGAFGRSGSLVGTVTLTPSVLASLLDRVTYLNIHTDNFGGGEIRGQVLR